jgi:guanylate kinase
VLEIDVQGAELVKEFDRNALTILVVPPSRAAQAERLRGRGEPEDQVQRRLALSDVEEERGKAIVDAIVVNDDLDRAVEEVAGILAQYRRTPPGEPT